MKTTLKLLGSIAFILIALCVVVIGDLHEWSFSTGVIFSGVMYEILEWLKPQPIALVFKVPEPSKN